jgi:hypothetical protein
MSTAPAKMMRPNDLCSAAYFGDVKKLKELLTVPVVEEEPPIEAEFDPTVPADPEVEEAAADRAKRRAESEAELKKRLQTDGPLLTRLSVVNVQQFGFGVEVEEDCMTLTTRFKPSKHCGYTASPLHWAVLGREHEAVEYLVSQGADVSALTPDLQVSVFDVIQKNDLKQTGRVLTKAIQARELAVAAEKKKWSDRNAILTQRAEARQRAVEEQKRKEEEERRKEEEEAAAAAREAEPSGNGEEPEGNE